MTTSDQPLEGIVVADFSRVLAGPLATMTLADLGATVIKVERPGAGDDTRSWGPPWTSESSSYFESVNRNKRSVALDLRNAEDQAVAKRLALRADVVVENFRTGTMDRLGLGPAELLAANPRLVYCSVTGFGSQAGADMPGYDFVVQAVGGLMSITGDPGADPTKVGVALVDVLTGKDAAVGILAALAGRERTGRGAHVEVNLLSSLLGSLANQGAAFLTTGVSPARMGNEHPSIAPYETLGCRDGKIAIACGNDEQFRRLSQVIGLPGLHRDARFESNPERVANRRALVDELVVALEKQDCAHWVAELTAAGIPVGEIGDIGDGIALARRLGLDPTLHVGPGHPDQIRHPVQYDGTSLTAVSPPPRLGEHNEEIRGWLEGDCEILGPPMSNTA